MIEVALHWWYIPAFLVVLAFVLPGWLFPVKGDFDFVSPLLGFATFVGLMVAAIAFCLGAFLA